MARFARIPLVFAVLALLAACASAPSGERVQSRAQIGAPDLITAEDPAAFAALAGQAEVLELARTIAALSPSVDPAEAARAAELSYSYTDVLAEAYEITDPPLLHNFKVNRGIKPRGLCWHWAEDMEARLKAEGFETLDLHRAIANHDNARIDHSTAIISAKGASMFEGVVVDPWRKGGRLTWVKVLEDQRYRWRPRAEVLAFYAARDGAGG